MLSLNLLIDKLTNLTNENKLLQEIISVLRNYSQIYLVGGIIRDIALEKEAKDIDLCTSLNINDVSNILKKSLKIVDTGKKHGTISVFLNELHVEITEFRGEKNNLISDLELRDFTINAIAFDVIKKEISDPFNGLLALKNNILRCPTDPIKVFSDDPLRILRMFRFSYAQNRIPDNDLIIASKKVFKQLNNVSIERIKDELSSILISENPSLAIKKLQEFNFLGDLFYELLPMVNCKQNKYHIHDVFEHTLDVIDNTPPILEVRLSALLHDIGKPHTITVDEQGERHFYGHEKVSVEIAQKFLTRLCFPKKIITIVLNIINLHMRSLDAGDAGIRRLIKDLGENFNEWLMLVKADKPPTMSDKDFEQRLNNFLFRYNSEIEAKKKRDFFKLAISGEDIMQVLGLSPSAKVGEIKKEIENLVLEDPNKNNKDFLIKYLEKFR